MAAVVSLLPGSGVFAQSITPGPTYIGVNGGSGGVQELNIPHVIMSGSVSAGSNVVSGADVFNAYVYYPSSSGGSPVGDFNDKVAYEITPSGAIRFQSLSNSSGPSGSTASGMPIPGQAVVVGVNNGSKLAVGNAISNEPTASSYQATSWSLSTGAVTPYGDYNPTSNAGVASISTVSSSGARAQSAVGVNSSGVAVGTATFYNAGTMTTYQNSVPVVWPSVGSAPTPLGTLGSSGTQAPPGAVSAISDNGTIVGNASDYTYGSFMGQRAAVWSASNPTAPPIALPTFASSSYPSDNAQVVNSGGVVGGYSAATASNGDSVTYAARWYSNGSGGYTADKLAGIGRSSTNSDDVGFNNDVFGINSSGDVVGQAAYFSDGTAPTPSGGTVALYGGLGNRATLWKFGTTTPTPLAIDGVSSSGSAASAAYAVNDADFSVGRVAKYNSSGNLVYSSTYTAALWNSNGQLTELNTLVPLSTGTNPGFTNLIEADGITNDGYISGYGTYDPDGTGPDPSYQSAFLIYDPFAAVPEPSTFSLIAAMLLGRTTMRRRR